MTASAWTPQARAPRISATRAPRSRPLPGVAMIRTRPRFRRSTSSLTRASEPAPKTTRCAGASCTNAWTKAGAIASASCGEIKLSSVAFAPDAERFLRRPIGDREQHRLLRCAVRVVLPRRHDEHVVLGPLELDAVDLGGTLAFRADEDRAIGRTVAFTFEALGQQ